MNEFIELMNVSKEAVRELKDIHNVHVYGPDDTHPADCQLCALTKRLQVAIKAVEQSLGSKMFLGDPMRKES